jgi:hypothetical protein
MSPKYTLNKEDVLKWLSNTIIFLAPALIIFLTAIQNGANIKDAGWVLGLWVLNTLVDLSKKYLQGN